MLKKIISALASVSLLVTATAFSTNNTQNAENDLYNSKSTEGNENGATVKGKNSIGKYIEKMSLQEKNEGIQPLNLKASTDEYKIAGIDFDLDSKKLTAVTTQSTDCSLKIEFINDDNEQDIYEMKTPLSVGNRIETVLTVDTSALPEFFKVRAVLVDNNGNTLCDQYILSKYMRFRQELDEATIHDYNEECIVNLDEKDDTNFFVLSEDTIRAISTENENTLVSADYDNDTYVFENINDSIRYLSEGDYFYAQPDDKNVVAVNVESINIEGNKATIKGGGDIDDMFEVIKIEIGEDDIDPEKLEEAGRNQEFNVDGVPVEESEDYSVVYEGIVEDEDGQPTFGYNMLSYADANTPKATSLWNKSPDTKKTLRLPIKFDLAPYDRDDNGNIKEDEDGNKKFKKYEVKNDDKGVDWDGFKKTNNYVSKNLNYCDIDGEINFTASILLTLEADLTVYKIRNDNEFGIDGSLEIGFTANGTIRGAITLGNPVVPIPIFLGLSVELGAQIKIGAKCTLSVSTSRKYNFSTHTSESKKKDYREVVYSDSDFAEQKDTEQKNEAKVSGDFNITFTPSINFSFFRIVKVGIETPIIYQVTATFFSIDSSLDDLDDANLKVGTVAKLAPSGSSKSEPIHACKACFKIEPSISVKISLTLSILTKKHSFDIGERTWNFTPLHWSLSYGEFKSGECKHYIYPTDITITGKDDAELPNLVLEIDNEKVNTGVGGGACFFLAPNTSHSYKVYSDEKVIKSGTFTVGSEYTSMNIALDEGVKKAGNSPVVTTTAAPPQNPEIHTVESVVSQIREETPDHLMIEYGQLGDNVYYSLYQNGLLYISGYGPMNITNDPIQNKSLVKEVLFEDYSHCIMSELADDKDNVILIDEYIEKYHEDLSKLYLEKHKDNIIEILKDYDVKKDDPYLDEMVDDYVYANSKDLARKYFDENKKDYESKLVEFKKELIDGLSDKVITSIGRGMLQYCTNLKRMTYEGSPNADKEDVFEIPPTIEEIGDSAFSGCFQIKNIIIPDTVKKYGYECIKYCQNLESFSVPYVDKRFAVRTFFGLDFDDRPDGREFDWNVMKNLYDTGELKNYYVSTQSDISVYSNFPKISLIPKNLKKLYITGGDTLPEDALVGLVTFEYIHLPDTMTKIERVAFHDYDQPQTTLRCDKVKVYIPASVVEIDNKAFDGNNSKYEIYGEKGSAAEKFAIDHKMTFHEGDFTDEVDDTITVRGDANGDGELDMSDAVLIMQALANPNKYGTNGTSPTHITAEGFKYADTDGNGLTVNDALRIQKYLLGLIKSFD